jgi:hypothetical protein
MMKRERIGGLFYRKIKIYPNSDHEIPHPNSFPFFRLGPFSSFQQGYMMMTERIDIE